MDEAAFGHWVLSGIGMGPPKENRSTVTQLTSHDEKEWYSLHGHRLTQMAKRTGNLHRMAVESSPKHPAPGQQAT